MLFSSHREQNACEPRARITFQDVGNLEKSVQPARVTGSGLNVFACVFDVFSNFFLTNYAKNDLIPVKSKINELFYLTNLFDLCIIKGKWSLETPNFCEQGGFHMPKTCEYKTDLDGLSDVL